MLNFSTGVTTETWPTLHAQLLPFWLPALQQLADGLDVDGWTRLPGGEDSAVFAHGDRVVKLVPPCYSADAERDLSVLRRLSLPVPTPRVEDVQVVAGWTAIWMTRLAGQPAMRAWPDVDTPNRERILGELGEVLAAFWEAPIQPSDGEPLALLDRFRARASRHEADGFVGLDAFLARKLPNPLPRPALIHLDLNDGNVMLERRDGHWRVSGVLDFVASRCFYPPLDLVTPGVFFCRGDPALLRALLREAGSALEPTELVAWHLLHPFSQIRRDLAMAGKTLGDSAEPSLIALWRT